MRKLKKYFPLSGILIILIMAWYFNLFDYISFTKLQLHQAQLQQYTHQHFWVVWLCFMAIYIVAVACVFPFASFLTIVAGFLFGNIIGTLSVVTAATIGASILFLAVKAFFQELFQHKMHHKLEKFTQGFNEGAISYLLMLRLVPLFPFWFVNIASALIGVRLRTYCLTTFFGIMPGTFVYVSVGSGLQHIFDSGQPVNMAIIYEPHILVPLLGLSVLSILPVIVKWFRHKNKKVITE